jgi:predicted ArsR family transcriptional regulator
VHRVGGDVNWIERIAREFDCWQQDHQLIAFAVAVAKKFSDDQAGNLVALLAYFAFVAGEPAIDALRRIAAERGRSFGETAISARGRPVTAEAALNFAVDTIRELGYEPRRENDRVVMVNCPFHALAQAQTQLVCDMNHALIGGMATTLEPHCPAADLEPAEDRCCVVLRANTKARHATSA